jgi:hypothetical protein
LEARVLSKFVSQSRGGSPSVSRPGSSLHCTLARVF